MLIDMMRTAAHQSKLYEIGAMRGNEPGIRRPARRGAFGQDARHIPNRLTA